MNIYLINTIECVNYDSYDSFCIVANSEEEARELANNTDGDESWKWDTTSKELNRIKTNFWLNPLETKLKLIGYYIGEETNPFILISSFNAE